MTDHADFMEQVENKSKEDGMKQMSEMKIKFESTQIYLNKNKIFYESNLIRLVCLPGNYANLL